MGNLSGSLMVIAIVDTLRAQSCRIVSCGTPARAKSVSSDVRLKRSKNIARGEDRTDHTRVAALLPLRPTAEGFERSTPKNNKKTIKKA
ncbi:hypothetical protein [Rhizobium gallicum]|uniref:hypothetical protein n=1 Tax=Rhizobium gallicum TaxID=56730 RepID=UPI00058718C4|nr:hypothetical protein [Rhizobium gallicum]